MKKTLILVLISSSLFADIDDFHINGFGTLGLSYQDNDDIIYRSSLRSSRGTSGKVSLQNDSKFGLQLDWEASEQIDFTIQGTVDSEGVNLEWANIKYTINDNHSFKFGQMRFPTAMYSDILKVGYSYNWVRLPEDVYGILPLTSYLGAEYNYRQTYQNIEYSFKLYGGRAKDTMTGAEDIGDYTIDLHNILGSNIAVSFDNLDIYLGYTYTDISIDNPRINDYFDKTLSSPISESEKDLLRYYDPRGKSTHYFSFGMRYEYENFYMLGEYVWIDMNNIISDNYAGYISMGYHIDKFTPHITFSKVTGKSNYKNSINNDIINESLQEMSKRTLTSQSHITLGLRYDWLDSVALKMQYDYIKEDSKGIGLSLHKESVYHPDDINLLSFSMDFVF